MCDGEKLKCATLAIENMSEVDKAGKAGDQDGKSTKKTWETLKNNSYSYFKNNRL